MLVSALLALAAAGCGPAEGPPEAPQQQQPLVVTAVNYPLAYFAERIGGERVEVVFAVPPGEDPAFWNPPLEAVEAFQAADVILLNGATYAKWVPRVTLPTSRMVDTSAAFADGHIEIAEAVTHSHGPGGEHSHTGTAFTTWLDFSLAARQAEAVRDALTTRRPELADVFEAGMALLGADLEALDSRLLELAGRRPGLPLVGSHPVYQYLARRYGLNLKTVTWEPDEPVGPERWHDLEHVLADHPAKWMLWEKPPIEDTVSRLQEAGISVAVFDPCMNRPAEGDFLSVMQSNVAALEAVFAPRP